MGWFSWSTSAKAFLFAGNNDANQTAYQRSIITILMTSGEKNDKKGEHVAILIFWASWHGGRSAAYRWCSVDPWIELQLYQTVTNTDVIPMYPCLAHTSDLATNGHPSYSHLGCFLQNLTFEVSHIWRIVYLPILAAKSLNILRLSCGTLLADQNIE